MSERFIKASNLLCTCITHSNYTAVHTRTRTLLMNVPVHTNKQIPLNNKVSKIEHINIGERRQRAREHVYARWKCAPNPAANLDWGELICRDHVGCDFREKRCRKEMTPKNTPGRTVQLIHALAKSDVHAEEEGLDSAPAALKTRLPSAGERIWGYCGGVRGEG